VVIQAQRLASFPQRCLDLGGEQVEVELVSIGGVERVEPESLPPRQGRGVQGADDNGTTRRLLVQLNSGGKNMSRERGADPETGVSTVDGKSAEQERGDRIGRAAPQRFWRGRTVDAGHRDAGVGDDDVVDVRDHPGRGRITSSILTGIATQPVVEDRLSAVELAPLMSARVQRGRAVQLSQAS